jgi:hypothetical protein
MPFSSSILPWWGWLLCAPPLALASWFFSMLYEGATCVDDSSKLERASEWTLAATFLIAAFLCALVGLVRFVKWAWAG